jgi:hypothetical protein
MHNLELTDAAWMALGIYIGYKSSHRRHEMESFGVDYNDAIAVFKAKGLVKGIKPDMPLMRSLFKEKFACCGSQTHQYAHKLGYARLRY